MKFPTTRAHGGALNALILMVLVLLLAAGARIFGAADRPVWTDEGFMAWITSDLHVETVVDRAETWDRHAPMYVFVVGGWREIAGDSRIALRFWAIMSGIVATALVYRIGADAFGGQFGRYAALLFAVLEMAVYYGQEIRGYGWLIMAVCWMTFFFLRYLHHPRPIWLIGFALSITFMLYTVYLGVVILAVLGLITLVWRGAWRHRFALLGAVLAGIALFVPWLVVILRHRGRVQSGIQGAPGTYTTTWENIRILGEFVWGEQVALMLALWALGAWAIVRLWIAAYRRKEAYGAPQQRHTLLAGLLFVLAGAGVFMGMIIANLWVAVVAARTLVFITPFVMLVCGIGLAQITPPARAIIAVILVGISLVTSPVIQPRLAYDDTAESLAAQFARGDLVILETGWDDNPFEYELSLALPDEAEIIRTLPWIDPDSITPVVPQVEPAIRAHDRVWIVQWLAPSQVIPWLESGEAGFQRVLAWEVSIGQTYISRYPDYPPAVLIALYERADQSGDSPSIYSDFLMLHDAVITDSAARGERLHVDLWWSVGEGEVDRDYSAGVYLMLPDEDRVVAQHDGPPGDTPTSQWTSQWTAGDLVFDRHTLTVPDDLAPGVYRVAVAVYWFGDGVPLEVDGGDFVVVGVVTIK